VLTDIAPSGGMHPISVTIADNLVYVLNAGGGAGGIDTISGLYLTEHGKLHSLPGSTQALSGANVGPAQVSFGLRGDVLVVTEKATNRVDTFTIDEWGRAGAVQSHASAGAVPFGFAVSRAGYAFVSEAPGSALTSYRLHENGGLSTITASLPNHQVAACWVVLSKDEQFAYTANAGSNSISAYRIAGDGSVALVDSTGLTATTDARPLEMAVSDDGRFLYSLDPGANSVVGFRTAHDGSLTRISALNGLPATVVGLVAR
jgi:6-phosphogluconolactonase (cycloisomerase 2 family)